MFSPQYTLPEDHIFVTNFGTKMWTLGFSLEPTAFGNVYGHGGNNGDFTSYFELSRDNKTGFVFFSNSNVGERLNTRLKPYLRSGRLDDSEIAQTYDVIDRIISPYEDEEYDGVELNAFPSDGFAWLKGREFSDGIIELDMKGSSEAGASFIGLAFRGENEQTYEGIYFRPFVFDAEDPLERSYMVQYHSLPGNSWRDLRGQHPGQYEVEIPKALDPDGWFHVRIEVRGEDINLFVDDLASPVMSVKSLSGRTSGKIGLWVGSNSSGRFANLNITDW